MSTLDQDDAVYKLHIQEMTRFETRVRNINQFEHQQAEALIEIAKQLMKLNLNMDMLSAHVATAADKLGD